MNVGIKRAIIRLIKRIDNKELLICIYEFIQGLLS